VVGGMVTLFQKIRHSVIRNEYLIGLHAAERLEQRGIMEWQAVEGLIGGSLLEEHRMLAPMLWLRFCRYCLTVLSSRLFGLT